MSEAATLEIDRPATETQSVKAAAPAVTPTPSQADHDYLMQALALHGKGEDLQAEPMFHAYLNRYPNDKIAAYSIAVILLRRGEASAAIPMLTSAVKAHPDFAPLWFAMASAQQGAGFRNEALTSYDKAIAAKPDYIEALVNSGALLREMHQHIAALERFNQVLTINPNYETALGNCAILLTEFKQSQKSIAMFERLLAINPNYDYGRGLLCYERMHICDWTDFDATRELIIEEVRADKKSCKSLGFMALSDDAKDHQTSARTFAQRFPLKKQALWKGQAYKHDRIKIAYVSADLREHPVGHLMAGIFEHHDKSRFETIAISLGSNDDSRLRKRMENAFEHFVDAKLMTAQEIAQCMRDMEVDIAIDLGGYTSDSRTEIFAHRPVPVQANFLGYPGTLGLDYIDYIIADQHVIPPQHQQFYDEKVAYLPYSYLPTDASISIADETPSRADCGLPEEGIVFCSFNHDYKIAPHVFDVWMRVLNAVPGSVLWLMSRNDNSQKNLRDHAQARGVNPDRLVFAKRVPRVEDHLARYRQADLFLDTHPYNAHTTAADALMAGLPVLTYMGQSFPSRVAGSLLHTLGMAEDLTTHSLQDYEDKAIALASNPQTLQQVRQKLAIQKQNSPLFDTQRFCRNLENIYASMWRKQQLGQHQDQL